MSFNILPVFLLLGEILSVVLCQGESDCKAPIHYTQLGCTPVAEADGGCAKSFDCDILKTRSKEVCYLDGTEIASGETFPYPINMTRHYLFTTPVCYDTCTCNPKTEEEPATLECEDCAVKPSYEPVEEETADCKEDGGFYKVGDQVYRNENLGCEKCYCRSTGVECIPISCGFELFHRALLDRDCAPSYGYKKCCPSRWRCPKDSEEVVPAETPSESELQCTFGKLTLKLGDSVPFDSDTCSNCTCQIPPRISCVVDEKCTPSILA